MSLAEPAAGLRHDLGDHPRAVPYLDIATAETQDAIDIAGRDPPKIGIVCREPDVSERPPSLHRALPAPADPAAPGVRFLQLAEGRALRDLHGLPPDCRVQDLDSVPGGLRDPRGHRCARSRHHRRYRGRAPRRRPRQTVWTLPRKCRIGAGASPIRPRPGTRPCSSSGRTAGGTGQKSGRVSEALLGAGVNGATLYPATIAFSIPSPWPTLGGEGIWVIHDRGRSSKRARRGGVRRRL